MSVFKNPNDEQFLHKVLLAYIQEWGRENVRVVAPKFWKLESSSLSNGIMFEFLSENTVSIQAFINGQVEHHCTVEVIVEEVLEGG